MTSRPPPASQPWRAASCAGVRRFESTSCQMMRSTPPHASTRSGRSSGVSWMTTGVTWFWFGTRSMPLTMSPGRSAMTAMVICPASWIAYFVRVVSSSWSPEKSAMSICCPNAGGWAYSTYVLSDCVGRSTTVPNRVLPWEPPTNRSSPWIGGPSFLRWTAMAIHDPTRAWPPSIVWASIVRPSRADTGVAAAPSDRRSSAAAARIRRRTKTPSSRSGGGMVGARTPRPEGKLRRTPRRPSGSPGWTVARRRPLSYDAVVPQPVGTPMPRP